LQPGLRYIGVAVPVGKLPAQQMRALATIADKFGSGDLRLTVWQNVIVPNIPAERVGEAQKALHAAGLETTVGTAMAGTVACTGNKGCRYAAADTKSHAVALANHIDKHFRLLQPVNIHVTGCPHSCAQHYIGDIGLLGTKVDGQEGYQVSLGGGSDQDQGLARELIPAIRCDDLPAVVTALFAAFEQRRMSEEESFLSFTRRHTIEQLRSFANVAPKENQ
jgi:ferredoxin-nitrite reductase